MIEVPGGYIADDGVLVVDRVGKPDPFAPPDTPPPVIKFWTGLRFLRVPTYSWPLNLRWDNNPLQFADYETTRRVCEMVSEAFGGEWARDGWSYETFEERVNVGPFQWRGKYMIRFRRGPAETVICAGLAASAIARSASAVYVLTEEIEDKLAIPGGGDDAGA